MSGPLLPFVVGYLFGRSQGGFHLFGGSDDKDDSKPWSLFGTSYKGERLPAHHGRAAHHVHPAPITHALPQGPLPQGIPMSNQAAVPWTTNAPSGLPPFPSGWRPTATTAPVISRASALLGLLPVGETKYERGGPNGWIAYHATSEAGKKYVTAWEPRPEQYYETRSVPSPSPMVPVTHAPPIVSPVVVNVPPSHHAQIQEHSTGPDVVLWQQRLNISPADGVFGPHTKAKTIAFQISRGLQPDGVVGPLTWAASETAAA